MGDNGSETYSANNEGKSVIAERFIKTLKKIISINTWQQYQKMGLLIN